MHPLQTRGRGRRVVLVVALIAAGILIDLRFAAHPALSIGLLLAFVVVFMVVRLAMLRRSERQR